MSMRLGLQARPDAAVVLTEPEPGAVPHTGRRQTEPRQRSHPRKPPRFDVHSADRAGLQTDRSAYVSAVAWRRSRWRWCRTLPSAAVRVPSQEAAVRGETESAIARTSSPLTRLISSRTSARSGRNAGAPEGSASQRLRIARCTRLFASICSRKIRTASSGSPPAPRACLATASRTSRSRSGSSTGLPVPHLAATTRAAVASRRAESSASRWSRSNPLRLAPAAGATGNGAGAAFEPARKMAATAPAVSRRTRCPVGCMQRSYGHCMLPPMPHAESAGPVPQSGSC